MKYGKLSLILIAVLLGSCRNEQTVGCSQIASGYFQAFMLCSSGTNGGRHKQAMAQLRQLMTTGCKIYSGGRGLVRMKVAEALKTAACTATT